MRLAARILCLGVITLSLLSLSETSAEAFSCGVSYSEELNNATDVVALGEVQSVRGVIGPSLARVRVERVFEGESNETLYVRIGGPAKAQFESGERYLIYANRKGGQLVTGACDGTQRLAGDRVPEEAKLGEGRRAGEGSTPGAGALRFWFTSPSGAFAVVAAGCVAGAGALLWRRER